MENSVTEPGNFDEGKVRQTDNVIGHARRIQVVLVHSIVKEISFQTLGIRLIPEWSKAKVRCADADCLSAKEYN